MNYAAGTVGALFHKRMTDNGLWPKEADAVLKSIADDSSQVLSEVLGKQSEGYPNSVFAAGWMVVTSAVLKYIDEHKPRHFARQMFE